MKAVLNQAAGECSAANSTANYEFIRLLIHWSCLRAIDIVSIHVKF
jgi:hypothetical protein